MQYHTGIKIEKRGISKMNKDELIKQLRDELTGDLQKDIAHLQAVAEDLRGEENADELTAAAADLAFEIMPDDVRAKMEDMTFVNGKRMDLAFGEALKLVNEGRMNGAAAILKTISDKIAQYYEGENPKYFSFRNPFEYHMYRYYFPNDTEFDRAPFDFAHYLALYGFVLLEQRDARTAEEVLERAVKFNPVSADVRFELAELCKFGNNQKKLLSVNIESLRYATTADRIAHVLANMGFYCYREQDFYSAAVFYFESIRFQPSQAVEFELQDVLRRMKTFGQKFTPPTHGQTIDVYEKYGLLPPPNKDLVNLAVTLAENAKQYRRTDLEALFNRVAFDLTNDPHFREEMERIAKEKREEQ